MKLTEYIAKGVSPFHVVAATEEWLRSEGFQELSMTEDWNVNVTICTGKGYYVKPYDASVFAFQIGYDNINYEGTQPVRMATAHTDQPMLKIKPNPSINKEGNYMLNVEGYGGMILHTWFDRPLSVAGKVVLKSDNVFAPTVKLFDSKSPIAVIPSLAIHMDREVNQKNPLKIQAQLLPIFGLKSELDVKQNQVNHDACVKDHQADENAANQLPCSDPFLQYLAMELGVEAQDILDYDLYLYNPAKPELVGVNQELLVSPRLDNLTSCYSAVSGMIESVKENDSITKVIALFDNEEIGSRSKQGADSTLFSQLVSKLLSKMQTMNIIPQNGLEQLQKYGFIVSLDVAHAYHPNYSDKSDPTTKTKLGNGIVLKTSGSQKYNSDSISSGAMMQLCEKYDIALQRQINHSDVVGGSTLGPIVSSYLPIMGVDMGVGVLGMHSSVETAAVKDCDALSDFVKAYFEE